LIEEKM